MKYLKSFESIRINIEKPQVSKSESGYVVNGIFFLVGFKEIRFVKLSEEEHGQLSNIINDINKKYQDDLLVELVGTWIHGPFAAKYGVWIPGYIFQVPCKTKEIALEVSNQIIKGLKSISEGQICIAISDGTIFPNKKDPFNSDGTAYHKSGRYIDDPNNCVKMINNNEEIKVI